MSGRFLGERAGGSTTRLKNPLREEEFEVFAVQVTDQAVVLADDGGGEVALGLLQLEAEFPAQVARMGTMYRRDEARRMQAVSACYLG